MILHDMNMIGDSCIMCIFWNFLGDRKRLLKNGNLVKIDTLVNFFLNILKKTDIFEILGRKFIFTFLGRSFVQNVAPKLFFQTVSFISF